MDEALAMAEHGRGHTSPNPMVGAVLVSPEGTVVGVGFHEQAGKDHAEIRALEHAGARANGATVYCTLEPCCHEGRTGPCAARLVEAGVSRVVIAAEDPNPRVRGGGVDYLKAHGVEVKVGVRRRAATRLNEAFFTWVAERRPFVIMKVATSLDGGISAADGAQTWLTSAPADQAVHVLRAEVDAIGVGSTTVLTDDPRLTARGIARSRPLTRVIFDRRLRVPPTARVFATLEAGPVVVLTSQSALDAGRDRAARLRDAGARVEGLASADLRPALTRLAEFEVTALLLEGGVTIHRAAWAAGVVDKIQIYITPTRLGPERVPWLGDRLAVSRLRDVRVRAVGPDTLIEGYVQRVG